MDGRRVTFLARWPSDKDEPAYGGGAVVQVAVLSHRRAADLLLLEVDAGEGSVMVPQVRCPWRPT